MNSFASRLIRKHSRGLGIAQSLKCLPHKYGEQSSIPRFHLQMPRLMADFGYHCPVAAVTVESPVFTARQSSLVGKMLGN